MLEINTLPNLKLKGDLGVTEIIAAGTLLSLAAAASYNFGFFLPIEWSFVSLLSVQDLVFGTLYSAIPVGSMLGILLVVSRRAKVDRGSANETQQKRWQAFWRALAIWGVPTVIMGAAAWAAFYYQAMLAYFLVLLVFQICATIARIGFRTRQDYFRFIITFAYLYAPAGLGIANVFTLADENRAAKSEIYLNNNTVHKGVIFRATSNYLFLRTPGAVRVIPLAEVVSILRLDGKGFSHG